MWKLLLLGVMILMNLQVSPCFALGLSEKHLDLNPTISTFNDLNQPTLFASELRTSIKHHSPLEASNLRLNSERNGKKKNKFGPYLGGLLGGVVGYAAGALASQAITAGCDDESECEFHWSLLLIPAGAIAGGVVGVMVGSK